MDMPEDNIKSKISSALEELFENDAVLLVNDVAERAITSALARYIQNYFPEWDVDCEYNRNISDVKRLKKTCNQSNQNKSGVRTQILLILETTVF